MTPDLRQRLDACPRPVILLEGTRKLPAAAHPVLDTMVRRLFAEFPRAVFRSGNAEGTDATFADAVARLDPSRLELVLPHAGMGRKRRPVGAACFSLDAVPNPELETLAAVTRQAGRDAGRLADYYLRGPEARKTAAGSKAAYLLRDTLKVAGSHALGLAPAALGIFWANPADPHGGGTGHTIRVCTLCNVPHLTQLQWAPEITPPHFNS
ncbi:MAG: hypothetical protein KA004_19355 [Verrucomicrobiales bacterium]|nr:hypothetical protein [Verrucomicrobiales bacterium]